MKFIRRAPGRPLRLGILPGTFNPVTVAHLALARAARLSHCGEVLFVLPRIFPHKRYSGATLEERVELLDAALRPEGEYSLAVADAGLFVEIAGECRQHYGSEVRLTFLCGRDAAERIVGWDYGSDGAFPEMLRDFDLLVAARAGEYLPPADLAPGIQPLALSSDFSPVSATEVRDRVARGDDWEHLVPAAIRPQVQRIYSRSYSTETD